MAIERLKYILGLEGDKEAKEKMKKTRKAIEDESTGIVRALKGIGMAALAYIGIETVKQIGRGIISMAKLGESSRLLEQSYKSLAAQAGQSAGAMLEAMKRGSQGTVKEMDLMKQANNAILLGLPVTAESMENLTRVAVRLGRAMGRTTNEAIGDLTIGIGRQSRMILDNLGIIVNTEQAYMDFAKALDTTVEKLTDAEKKQAFYNAAMAAAETKAASLKDVSGGLTEQWGKLSVMVEDRLTKAINEKLNPALERSLELLTKVLGLETVQGLEDLSDAEYDRLQRLRVLSMQQEWTPEIYQERRHAEMKDIEAARTKQFDIMRGTVGKIEYEKPPKLKALEEEWQKQERAGRMSFVTALELEESTEKMRLATDAMRESDAELIESTERFTQDMEDLFDIRINTGEAEKKYAAQIGKTVEGLTDADQAQAAYNATMEATLDIVNKVPDLGDELGLDPAYQTLGEFIQDLVDLEDVDLTELGERLGIEGLGEDLSIIPKKMEDGFSDSLRNVEAQMQALGMRGSAIFGGLANIRAGIGGLGGLSGAAVSPKWATDFMAGASSFGQALQGLVTVQSQLGGVIGSLFGIGGGKEAIPLELGLTSSEEAQKQHQEDITDTRTIIGLLESMKAGTRDYAQLGLGFATAAGVAENAWVTAQNVDALISNAQARLENLVSGGPTAGSATYGGVTTITERQAGNITGILETLRMQDEVRNALLRDISSNTHTTANNTAVSAGVAMMRFSGAY